MTDAQRWRKANKPSDRQRPPSFAGETLVVDPATDPGAFDGQIRELYRPGSALVARLNANPPRMVPYPQPVQTMGAAQAARRNSR